MIYLDNSATSGFKPSAVMQEVENALLFSANPTRSGHKRALSMGQKVFHVRELVANLFNFDSPQRVIFTKNCTEALNLGILGTLKVGGHVITTENEHNSVLRPLYHLYENGQIELSILPVYPNGSVSLVDLQNAIQQNTYLVVVNHVSNVTGGVNPIKQIGDFLAKKDILFMVDNAQGAGYLDTDLHACHVDLMAMPAHKGLYSPMGLGFLLVNQNIALQPLSFGGTGTFSESLSPQNDFPESFEAGTLPAVAICGAIGGISYVIDNKEDIHAKMKEFDKILYRHKFPQNLKIYSVPNGVGIFTFAIDGLDSAEVSNILDDKFDIATRSGLMCAPLIHRRLGSLKSGLVRASFCSFNTLDECDIFINAVEKICNRNKKD